VTKKERDYYRKKLLEKKQTILERLNGFYTESKDLETDVAQDPVDKADSSYTKEFLLSLSDAERELVLQIDQALLRLQRDEFGRCQSCQKEIGKKRLEAVPWSSLCIACQEKAEEEAG
jgi:DnaK suppressor protein